MDSDTQFELGRRGALKALAGGAVAVAAAPAIGATAGKGALAFPEAPPTLLPIMGSDKTIPVNRIYCIGDMYPKKILMKYGNMDAANIKEPPFMMVPGDSLLLDGEAIERGAYDVSWAVELVVVVGKEGHQIPPERGWDHILGYAVGNDLSRGDFFTEQLKHGQTFIASTKGFARSKPCNAVTLASATGHKNKGRIWCKINGELKSEGDISEMIWDSAQIVSIVSQYYTLKPGDLIFMSHPPGHGSLTPGDKVECGIDGLGTLTNSVVAA